MNVGAEENVAGPAVGADAADGPQSGSADDQHNGSADDQFSGFAALAHPVTRRMHNLVLEHGWITRDAAAAALQVSRSVAAFHLDKLADAGLVQTRYERLTGRRGPGAGRPAKLYGRSDKELELSLPRRRYALAGSMLADAVSEAGVQGRAVEQTLRDVARDTGARVGAGTGEESPVEPAGPLQTEELLAVLEREGFEPRLQGEEIVLRNCPFHRLAQQQRQLVCGMNLDFLSGLLTGTRSADCFRARLAPEPGYCCVRIDVAGPPA